MSGHPWMGVQGAVAGRGYQECLRCVIIFWGTGILVHKFTVYDVCFSVCICTSIKTPHILHDYGGKYRKYH